MSIATEIERLQTAKANIKSAIENKGVTVGDGTIDTYAEKISEISGGEASNLFEYATQLDSTFKKVTFPDGYELILSVPNVTSMRSLFSESRGIKKITLKGNTAENALKADSAFRTPDCESIDLSEFKAKFSDMSMAFYWDTELVEILGEIDFTVTTDTLYTFSNCKKLATIRAKVKSISVDIGFGGCSMLSTESTQSIIDGLADLTGGTAQTLTLHADVGTKLTDEQKATITAKNWTLVY